MISIIIPAYNIGNYIKNCLDSVRQQTYTDYEVIVVNDGSTDDTLSVLNSYKDEYHDFPLSIIDKSNGGVTAARRDGFLASKSEWICFMDGDDMLPVEALKIFTDEIGPEVSVVCGSFERFHEGQNDFVYNPIKVKAGTYPCSDVVKFMLSSKFYTGPWGKLYKRDLISEECFNISPEITNKEDTLFNYKVFSKADGDIVMTYKSVYRYCVGRLGSAFSTMYLDKNLDLEYEMRVQKLIYNEVAKIPGFMENYSQYISIRNYIDLCLWKNSLQGLTVEQYDYIEQLYGSIHLKDIAIDGFKKYIKLFLVRVAILKAKPK